MTGAPLATQGQKLRRRGAERQRGNREVQRDHVTWPIVGIAGVLSPSSTVEHSGEKDWDMEKPQGARTAASPGERSATARAGVILTPDQRVRVFISSTLGELAEERAAARRAITRLHLVPVWYESGARPHPPRRMYQAYL